MMPAPFIPTADTPQGREMLKFSMLTCAEQISHKDANGTTTFSYMKHIRPRRALIIDEEKQIVGTFPLFVHDGTRRGAPPDSPPGMRADKFSKPTPAKHPAKPVVFKKDLLFTELH